MGLLSWIPHRGTLPALPSLSEIAAGPGTPVVFLHGFLASPNNFELPLTALWRSLYMAFISTMICIILGYPAAEGRDVPRKPGRIVRV